jgi:ubiquinone/menaquinone biosynthesis C-methylase UbiE
VNHSDHVALLARGVTQGEGGTWADLGAGTGAFTLALADLIGPHGVIHAVDRDRAALAELRGAFVSAVPQAELHVRVADFTRPQLDLAELDGVVMANSLHFLKDKAPVLALVRGYLRRSGRLLIVEYDSDRGNDWVPYPVSLETWLGLAERAGFRETRLMGAIASRFLGRIYSALSLAP